MPSVLSDADRETVKRTVPKSANKILAVAVARLYVAYPNKLRWTYTGLQGAAVLSNDLIGNTFWLKLVDISSSSKGVIWDQEIYDQFFYNQDRTFFHTFELEDCLAGLSFVDEKEAKTFKKKMDEREKSASKETKSTPFQGVGESRPVTVEKAHGRFTSFLHGHRSSHTQAPPPQVQPVAPIREPISLLPHSPALPPTPQKKSGVLMLDEVDPSWRSMLSDLLAMGITEDQIEENAEFIKSYILDQRASGVVNSEATNGDEFDRPSKAPPPPPPSAFPARDLSPQNTGSTASSRRGPPPAPPAPRRAVKQQSPPRTPPRTPSPPRPAFRVPPPLTDAGRFAYANAPAPPARAQPSSNAAPSGPPPPPRPPKTPIDEIDQPRFAAPPPFQRSVPPPPAPPSRGAVPPPPPRAGKDTSNDYSSHQIHTAPPPLPPKVPTSHRPFSDAAPPPAPPSRHPVAPSPVPPPLPPSSTRQPSAVAPPPPPPPPPPPSMGMPTSVGPPPPPPPPPPGGPAAPPLPPGRVPAGAPPAPRLPAVAGDRGDLLAAIRGNGTGGLRRVSEAEKRDRSAAAVPGGAPDSAATAAPSTSSAGGGGMMDALAQALSARNKKVSTGPASDDEDDDDDDWDDDPKPRRK